MTLSNSFYRYGENLFSSAAIRSISAISRSRYFPSENLFFSPDLAKTLFSKLDPGRFGAAILLPVFSWWRYVPAPRETALTLFIQLLTTAALSVILTLVHGAGVVGISKALRLDGERPRRRRLRLETVPVLSAIALLLFALHAFEIALFAGFYLAVGAFPGIEEALFFSTTAYATLSQPASDFPSHWSLVAAMEGMIGFLLIGWSTAFLATDMNRLLRE